jgi:hypothetical protein
MRPMHDNDFRPYSRSGRRGLLGLRLNRDAQATVILRECSAREQQ